MRILLIGGNGFIGRFAVAALKQQGHALAVVDRGTTDAPPGVDEILGDRHQLNASAQPLTRFAPDVVIDLIISSGPLAELPLTEESELHRSLDAYPTEIMQIMRQIFPWVTDDYDKVPAERAVMNDR